MVTRVKAESVRGQERTSLFDKVLGDKVLDVDAMRYVAFFQLPEYLFPSTEVYVSDYCDEARVTIPEIGCLAPSDSRFNAMTVFLRRSGEVATIRSGGEEEVRYILMPGTRMTVTMERREKGDTIERVIMEIRHNKPVRRGK